MAEHSFKTLMQRLSKAGFKRQFVTTALMPDWWEESYAQDRAVLSEIEIRVARFLDVPLAGVRNAEAPLGPRACENAQLRRVRDIDRDRLAPAIHTAIRIARAVVRNLKDAKRVDTPPTDAFEWRRLIQERGSGPIQLAGIVEDLWNRGIPIIPLDVLPAPSFQGLACIVEEHPVIVLGHKYDEPGRVAFLLAHEAGHIAAGDCSPEMPVVDEDEAVRDGTDMESAADRFATCLLIGEEDVDIEQEGEVDAKGLAQRAFALEGRTGADASALIYAWAARTLDYATATMAVKALYRSGGARRDVRRLFDQYVDLDSAGESDRALLRCVYGEPLQTALAG